MTSEQPQPEPPEPSADEASAAAPVPTEGAVETQAPAASDHGKHFKIGFPVTKLLIAANVLVFASMCFSSGGEELLDPPRALLLTWGADYGPLTLSGEYWRIFTNMFVHVGVFHILMNMWALWTIGRTVEELFGPSKYLFVYVASGLVGSLVSLYFHPTTPAAGASGAIMGAFGAFYAFVRFYARNLRPEYVSGVTRWIVTFMLINLFWGFSRPGIDNAAHIGGFIGGFIAGLSVAPPNPRRYFWSAANLLWALAVVAAILLGCYMEVSAFQASS